MNGLEASQGKFVPASYSIKQAENKEGQKS